MTSFSLFVARRYLAAKRKNHFISFISLVSIIGLLLGVTVLITVLSVMNGFDSELKERILGLAPHISAYSTHSKGIQDAKPLLDTLSISSGVTQATPFVEAQGLLSAHGINRFTMFQGIDPVQEEAALNFNQHMVVGSLDLLEPGQFRVVLGSGLAGALGVDVGDKVTMILPKGMLSPAGIMPRMKRFTVAGIFSVGYEFDANVGLINLVDAQRLLKLTGPAGYNIRIDDMYAAPRMRVALEQAVPDYFFTDWTRRNANFFEAVKMEKTLMFLLLLFIVLVAAFNILATLVMLVTEKTSDIAILRTLGASPRQIMLIFMLQGTFIGLIGTVLGVLGGLLLASNVTELVRLLENLLQTKLLSADVYYISYLPSVIEARDVIIVASVSILMSFLFTIYPAYRSSQVQIAESLRYE